MYTKSVIFSFENFDVFFLYNFLAIVLSSFPGLCEWKITEKTHRRQVDSILFSTKEGGKRNEMK